MVAGVFACVFACDAVCLSAENCVYGRNKRKGFMGGKKREVSEWSVKN